jgi:hypothetical protein
VKKILLGLAVVLVLFLLLYTSFLIKNTNSMEEVKYSEVKN